jgi:N-acetylglucosaminyl-diphospho-decaprenol L-rhamnosyltransferase
MPAPVDEAEHRPADVVAIVVHYGDPSLTLAAIESVAAGSVVPRAIVIVDNGPTALPAGDAERAAGTVPLRVISTGTNLGYAPAIQFALAQPELEAGSAVWLLNNDATAATGSLAALVAALAEGNGRALVSSRVVTPSGETWFERARFYPWLGVAGHRTWPTVRDVQWEAASARPARGWLSTPYLPGCSLLIPDALLKTVGGLDPSYFLYGEDIDFCVRATRAGWRLAVATRAPVVHAASSGSSANARERRLAESSLRLTRRYAPAVLPLAVAGSTAIAFYRGLRARDASLTTARLRGVADGLRAIARSR